MSITECLEVECEWCGMRLARKDNGWRFWLLLHRQRERRARFAVRELVWQQIGEKFQVGDQQVSVSSRVLNKAIQYASGSVVSPETASPGVLHPANSDNFAKIVNEFRKPLRGEYEVNCSSADLFKILVDMLDSAVGQAESSGHKHGNLHRLPRNWEALALLWLTRATQLAGIPGYDGREPLTVFENRANDDEDLGPGDEEIDELEELMKDE